MVGVAVGSVSGLFLGKDSPILREASTLFLNLLMTTIAPLVFTSVAAAISKLASGHLLRRSLVTVGALVVLGGVSASLVTVLTINIVGVPHFDLRLSDYTDPRINQDSHFSVSSMLSAPSFIDLFSISHLVPLVIASIIVGLAITAVGEAGRPLTTLLQSGATVMNQIVSYVMVLAPVGVGAYFGIFFATIGSGAISGVLWAIGISAAACVVFLLGYSTVLAGYARGGEGIRAFWRVMGPPAILAAGSCSSSACIPCNTMAATAAGIRSEIRDLVIPLGASLHKSGYVIGQIVKCYVAFAIAGRTMGISELVICVAIAILSAVAVGTVPTGGFIGEIMLSSAFDFGPDILALLVALGTIADPFYTVVNVTTDIPCAMVAERLVARGEERLP
jgi:proton/sodium-glutamate symport protein